MKSKRIITTHKEWSNEYNPFNSWKSISHESHYEAIINSESGKNPILPPININLDLTNLCNYNCRFCMFGGQRERTDDTGRTYREYTKASLKDDYVLTLPKLWKDWGVKAVCVGGGGDPTCHHQVKGMLKEIKKQGLDLGFVSNGYLCNNLDWWKTIVNTSTFVGFSIDAGNKENYAMTKGVPADQFDVVINNIRGINKAKQDLESKCTIGYKFLIDDKNYNSIYQAIELASKIGVNHIQIRPAISPTQIKLFKEHGEEIWNQVDKGRKQFERPDYLVMGVQHKFNPDMSKKHAFSKCRATMLTSTWCADGSVYMCTDTRGNPWAYLSDHYPDPQKFIKEYWGSKEHWDKVNKIDFKKKCDRCTLAPYNEAFEKVFINDEMQRNLI